MISVVIPTHDRSDLLRRAIKSVQNQTMSDIEIIVVSDGSKDNTRDVVFEMKESDDRIKLIEYFPAQGANTARNKGIEASNGEFIAFLDDDDEWMPTKIEKQIHVMQENEDIGLVYTGVNTIYVNEGIEYSSFGQLDGDLSNTILLGNCIGTTSTVMLRKSVLPKSGLFDINLPALQDFDLWIRVCQCCYVGAVNEKLINYYNYTGKKQISASTQKYLDALEAINEKYAKLFSELNAQDRKIKASNDYLLFADKAMRNENGKMTRNYVRQALKIKFSKKAVAYYILSFAPYKLALFLRSKI